MSVFSLNVHWFPQISHWNPIKKSHWNLIEIPSKSHQHPVEIPLKSGWNPIPCWVPDPAFKAASVPSSSPMRRKVLCATKADSATRLGTPLRTRRIFWKTPYSWTYLRTPRAYNWDIHPNSTHPNWDMAEISQLMVGLEFINGPFNHISQLDIPQKHGFNLDCISFIFPNHGWFKGLMHHWGSVKIIY